MRAEHAKIQDFSLIYEGNSQFVGTRDVLNGKDPRQFGKQYQGLYYYRSDGAELIDVYTSGLRETSLTVRYKKSVLRDPAKNQVMFSQTKMISDLDVEESMTRPGYPAMLSGPESPQALLFISLFHSIPSFQTWGYEFQTWEVLDGRRCARIKLKWVPGPTDWYHLMWVNMGRGCHPVRIEDSRGGRMVARLDHVELKRFELPDHVEVWMPVKGRIEGFEWAQKPYEEPVTREDISVVDGSVSLNQGLSDAVFKVGPTPKTPVTTRLEGRSGGLSLRKAFLSIKRDPKPRRANFEGVQKKLDTMLKAADSQTEKLEASSPARQPWNGVAVFQYVAVALGSLSVLAAGVMLFRSRGRR